MDSTLDCEGLQKYSVYCLPQVRHRANNILTLFGFETYEGADNETWTTYFTLNVGYSGPALETDYFRPTNAWYETQPGHTETSCDFSESVDRSQKAAFKYILFLVRVTEAASWLAFTDWDQNVRLLSTRLVEPQDKDFNFEANKIDILEMMSGIAKRPCVDHWNTTLLCQMAVEIILAKDERRQNFIFPLSIVSMISRIMF